MKNIDHQLTIWGGISGIAGITCYILAITVSLPLIITYVLTMAWPVLSIIFAYSIYKYISVQHQSHANNLAFIMAILGFTLLAIMASAQLAVKQGISEYIASAGSESAESYKLMLGSVRLIDMGIDVAWDLFIGMSLIFLSFAVARSTSFGMWWSIPAFILASALIVLNVWTFPYPPDSRGLIDVGPFIGLFITAISIKLIILGVKMKSRRIIIA